MGRDQRNLAAGSHLTHELNELADRVGADASGAPAVLGGRSPAFAAASARVRAAVQPVIECLEGRQLLAGDFNTVQSIPFAAEFSGQAGGMKDAAGLGTGFTFVQANRLGNEYQPSLLHIQSDLLKLTTTGTSTAGGNYGTDNTLVNGLGTQFDATAGVFTITAKLKGPLSNLNALSEQAGVMFGPDQDNYVKLVVAATSSGGQTLQFADEQNAGVHTVNTLQAVSGLGSAGTVELRLAGNPSSGTVNASYRLNGSGGFVALPGTLTLSGTAKTAFFNTKGRAGIIAFAKNNLAPVTVSFDRFEIAAAGTTPATGTTPSVTKVTPFD